MSCTPVGTTSPPPTRAPPAVAQARGPTHPQASEGPQGRARLPGHRAALAVDGGVPVEPRFRHPRPAKPEIMVIADISGSVASFARFTLHLVYAISSQFSKVRAFVFVDGLDEVTRFFEGVDDPALAVHRINTEADVIWIDGHSDYGHALRVFNERYGDSVTSRTSVLLLATPVTTTTRRKPGCSRAAAPGPSRLLAEPRASRLLGLWDSIVDEYAVHCDQVVEVRTLRQLERFVGELT